MTEAQTDTSAATALAAVLVAGFLGAGKSRIVEALTGPIPGEDPADAPFRTRIAGSCAAVPGCRVTESSPFLVPGRDAPGTAIVTAVDAINVTDLLSDPDLEPLVAAQIRAADVVVVTCGDVAEPDPARRAVAALTAAPVLLAHEEADLARKIVATAVPGAPRPARDHSGAFTTWRYRGSAVLTREAMAAFVTGRPRGAWRIRGQVMLPDGGGRIDVFGRGRRTWLIDRPSETGLAVAGPAGRLSVRDMDLAFAEAVAAAAYDRGVIACR